MALPVKSNTARPHGALRINRPQVNCKATPQKTVRQGKRRRLSESPHAAAIMTATPTDWSTGVAWAGSIQRSAPPSSVARYFKWEISKQHPLLPATARREVNVLIPV